MDGFMVSSGIAQQPPPPATSRQLEQTLNVVEQPRNPSFQQQQQDSLLDSDYFEIKDKVPQ